ncbi:hypothetical protein N7532_006135 [Penicillium argentinense]|uniref:DUF2423 domain-containing protein n=1 Tax=Penicillium argentinense TaxID=1131581 RepID=A0A9W9KAG8_9EURO|nr:uncharacterized protein N7532_006135 [Penicillium argentinense]KAJ5099134.1 hypothetical protein N7532_006135 [Penicillium argentinense]
MAKSVRASVSKRNRANLRKKVFGPVVDARTERLAAKLQELASQPRPEAPGKEDTGMYATVGFECVSGLPLNLLSSAEQPDGVAQAAATGEEMDVDTKPSSKSSQKPGRVQKRNRKPRNSIVFQKKTNKDKKGSKRK